jgi:hypothetical protein
MLEVRVSLPAFYSTAEIQMLLRLFIAFQVTLPYTSSPCSLTSTLNISLVTCLASITPLCSTILVKKTPAFSLLYPHLQVVLLPARAGFF